jgi:cell pole-organizing protein PopZ
MTQPAKAQEPSMEEILASIRRIISDDEAKPAANAAAPAAAPPKATAPKAEAPKTVVPKAEIARPAPAARAPMTGIPPSKIAPARPAPAAAAEPPAAAKNSQAEIDAMMASFDAPAPAARPEEPEEPEVDADADVFELTEQMAVPEMTPPTFNTIEPDDDLEFTEAPVVQMPPQRAAAMEPPAFVERTPPRDLPPTQQILSGSTVSAVESAFNTLANTVLSNNARTLEDLVKEMLRPMLKSWLDDNLPNLVERIVKAEIERVSRGR